MFDFESASRRDDDGLLREQTWRSPGRGAAVCWPHMCAAAKQGPPLGIDEVRRRAVRASRARESSFNHGRARRATSPLCVEHLAVVESPHNDAWNGCSNGGGNGGGGGADGGSKGGHGGEGGA